MSWRIVKQPNGRLGLFSDIVDDFVNMDLDYKQAVGLCIREGLTKEEAERKVDAGADDIIPWTKTKGDGKARWTHAIERVRTVHGESKTQLRERMGTNPYSAEKWKGHESDGWSFK